MDFLESKDVAELLVISAEQVRILLRKGLLPGHKEKGKWRISREQLNRYLSEHETNCDDYLITPRQVARLLKLSDGYVRSFLRQKKIPGTREGSRWYVSISELEEYIQRCRENGRERSQAWYDGIFEEMDEGTFE